MPPKSLDAWLAKCIEDELSAVIEWKQHLRKGFKPDPESRFSDDGSNFRSEVRSPPTTTTVQLIEVLTWEDVATAYVSDGIMKVKVRLSADAVATFEEDSGASFNSDVKGDVFRLVRFTVVSTPFGPADGFVQLHVEEIEYEALRRGLFDGMPVERDYGIRTLIESTKLLRVPENASKDAESRPRPAAAQLQATVNVSSSTAASTAQPQAVQTQQTVQTRAAPEARPPSPKGHVERPQAQNMRKHPGPTLSNDGYELESGVNLHGPVVPNNRGLETTSVGKQAVNIHLLGLLGGTKAPASKTHPSKASPSPQTQAPLQTQHSATPAATASMVYDRSPERAEQTIPESSPVHMNGPATGGNLSPSDHAIDGTTLASQLETDSLPTASLPRARTLFAYARRKVSTAQRKLLDNPASWLPSLPGRQFPKPNVPMELLSKWNAEAAASPPDLVLSQKSRAPSQHEYVSLSEVLDDSDSDSDHSDDATQEYPPSPEKNWLPRQAAMPPSTAVSSSVSSDNSVGGTSRQASVSPRAHQRPDMPPSSTLGSVIHGTPLDGELEIAVPCPLPTRNGPEKRKTFDDTPPPAKRPSHFPLTSPLRASQQPSTSMGASKGGKLSSQAVAPACHLNSHPHVAPTIRNPRMQAPAIDSVTRMTHPLPARPSTFEQSSWQTTPRSSSPTTQQPSALSTSPHQAEKDSRTSAPLGRFKDGTLSLQSPSGPRSDQSYTFQAKQPEHGGGGEFRGQAHELEYSGRDTSRERHGSRADPPRNPPAKVLMHQQFAPSGHARDIRVMDVTDPGIEIVSSSVSPQQSPSRALARGKRPLPTPQVAQSHVERSAFDQPGRKKPTLSGRKAWLKANYVVANSGKEDLPAVFKQYKKSFPDDKGVCIDDILEAARYAFDGVKVTPYTRYTADINARETQEVPHLRSSHAPAATSSSKRQRRRETGKGSPMASKAVPSASQHPGLLHRQKRMEFINEERRKAWLQSSYVPSSNGNVPLATILEHYRQACPEDDQVQLDTLLSAAHAIRQSWNISLIEITAETLYCRKLETMGTARGRLLTKHPKTGETAYEQARREWIKDNYKPGRKGTFQLATVMARYKHSCPDDDLVGFEDFLRAGQAAWPNQGVTPGLRWTFKHELENLPKPRSPAGIAGGKARHRELKARRKLKSRVVRDIVTWLKTRYTWDPAGNVGLDELWTAYQAQKIYDVSKNRKWYSKALEQAFPAGKKQNKGTWRFYALRNEASNPDSAHRTKAPTESSAVSADIPARWFQEHYRKDEQGHIHIEDLIRAFECSNTGYIGIEDERLVNALHHAFGSVSESDRFSRREMDSSRHGGLARRPATFEADSCGSASQNELSYMDDLDVPEPKLEPTASVADLYTAYLKIQHGRHNAFGEPIPVTRQKWSVDVLKWDI